MKKSMKQVRYLLSSGSPLSGPQQAKLKDELHTGAVKIAKRVAKKPTNFSQAKFNKVHQKLYE